MLYNQAFGDLFPSSRVTHFIRQGSNHATLYLVCNSEVEAVMKPFKFLSFWIKHPKFKKLVSNN